MTLFMHRVEKRPHGCWLWTGVIQAGGYGRFRTQNRGHMAHRWLYEQLVGPIPEGMQLDHLCRVRNCVRPDHLEPVTPRENTLRSNATSAVNARKDVCVNGHPFTPENTYWRPTGGRTCRECGRARWRKWNAKRSAARADS